MFDFQIKQILEGTRRRAVPRAIAPFFATLLAAVSLFMAVILFGAGSILGGLAFSLPVGAWVYALWRYFDAQPGRAGKRSQ